MPQGSRMETAAQGVEHGRRKRQYRTAEEKRRIVEATLSPDVSVAVVARRHGVNANQVFQWRKLYRLACSNPPRSSGRITLAAFCR